MFALVIAIAGSIVAGLLCDALPLLGKLGYSTCLFIGWLPLFLWMHYCRVGFNGIEHVKHGVIAVALFFAWIVVIQIIDDGPAILSQLPANVALLCIVLPIETIIGIHLLSQLPGGRISVDCNQHPENAT